MIFTIDPSHVRDAVISGKVLVVELYGPKLQFKKVTLADLPARRK